MMIKQVLLCSTIALMSCQFSSKTMDQSSAYIADKDTFIVAQEPDSALAKKQPAGFGELIATLPFYIKTTKQQSDEGNTPPVSIQNYEADSKNLVDPNVVVITEQQISIVIDYPLTNECRFELKSSKGFTRRQLLTEIGKKYAEIYAEEERTATTKTIAPEKRTGLVNRNATNGKYGIWGHDLVDLSLLEIYVYKDKNGRMILSLGIES